MSASVKWSDWRSLKTSRAAALRHGNGILYISYYTGFHGWEQTANVLSADGHAPKPLPASIAADYCSPIVYKLKKKQCASENGRTQTGWPTPQAFPTRPVLQRSLPLPLDSRYIIEASSIGQMSRSRLTMTIRPCYRDRTGLQQTRSAGRGVDKTPDAQI